MRTGHSIEIDHHPAARHLAESRGRDAAVVLAVWVQKPATPAMPRQGLAAQDKPEWIAAGLRENQSQLVEVGNGPLLKKELPAAVVAGDADCSVSSAYDRSLLNEASGTAA